MEEYQGIYSCNVSIGMRGPAQGESCAIATQKNDWLLTVALRSSTSLQSIFYAYHNQSSSNPIRNPLGPAMVYHPRGCDRPLSGSVPLALRCWGFKP